MRGVPEAGRGLRWGWGGWVSVGEGGWGAGRVGRSGALWFRQRSLRVTVPEDLVPGSAVARVQAQGSDVRYELLPPARGPLFSIGRGEGRRARGAGVGGLRTAPPSWGSGP